MTIAEKPYEAVKDLPEQQAAEVLDFVEHLKTRQRCQTRQSLDDFFRPYQPLWSGILGATGPIRANL